MYGQLNSFPDSYALTWFPRGGYRGAVRNASIIAATAVLAAIAAAGDAAAGEHGIGAAAGYSSYLSPQVRRGFGGGGGYRYLFLGDLGLRADLFISRHTSLVTDGKLVAPEAVIESASLGFFYRLDLGPATPYAAVGASFYRGDLDKDTTFTWGYYMGAGVEFPLAGPLAGAVEIDYFAQPPIAEAFPAYMLVVFRCTWVLGTPVEDVSKI